jgi:hypothetical protein
MYNKPKLFVRIGGLDRHMEPAHIISLVKDIFAQAYPDLSDDNIQLITDKKFGGYRDFCFVMCEQDKIAELTQALDGTEFEGYNLTVNEAQPLEDRPSNGGGRSFGGGNRNGGGYNNRRGGDRDRGGYSNRY